MTVSGFEEYVVSYEYHDNNWLLREKKVEDGKTEIFRYQYDANGNQCYRRWEKRGILSHSGRTGRLGFTCDGFKEDEVLLDLREYDGFGRLITVYRDGSRTKYQYRPDGLRHSKTTWDRMRERGTIHCWDGADIVMDICGNGLSKSRYLRGIGLICQQIGNDFYFYLFNGHGDVVQRISERGDAAPEYKYDAFGNQRDKITSDPNPFRYCGEYWDAETGTVYLRNRDYEARSGRFTQEDPARDGGNWYCYCNNNPLYYSDPSGLKPLGTGPNGNFSVAFLPGNTIEEVYAYADQHRSELSKIHGSDQVNSALDRIADKSPRVLDYQASANGPKNMLYSATTSVLQWGLDFGYEVSNMNPMLGLEDAAALGIIGIAALVEGGIWVWGALANNKIPEAPSKLKNGDKVKTPESHKNEWSRNRDGSYTHGKTGWNAKQDRSGHGGPHWDMKPPRGSGHINVGSNGNIFGGSR